MRQCISWCAVFFSVVFFSLHSHAATRYVWTNSPSPGSGFTTWDTAAHEIQLAIDASDDGDVILVRSVNGPTNTIIEGQWHSQWYGSYGPMAVRCAYVGSNAVLDGFTLTNGYTGGFSQSGSDRKGGGALCEASGTLTNCVIVCSHGYELGGGVYGGAVMNCVIFGCKS